MDYLVHKLSLDMHKSIEQAILYVKEGDTKRKLYVTLTNKGKVYQIGEGCTAVFSAKKENGDTLFNYCDIEGGLVVYEFTGSTATMPGKMDCEIKLYDADNGLITGPKFAIIVEEVVNKDGDVESSDEYSALTELISSATGLEARLNQHEKNTALMVVTRDEQWTASHTSLMIYEHILNGGTAIAYFDGALYSLSDCTYNMARFDSMDEDAFVRGFVVYDGGAIEQYDHNLATQEMLPALPNPSDALADGFALVTNGGKWGMTTAPVVTMADLSSVNGHIDYVEGIASEAKSTADTAYNKATTAQLEVVKVGQSLIGIEERVDEIEAAGYGFVLVDDGDGNVTITDSAGLSITDDSNGNVVIM